MIIAIFAFVTAIGSFAAWRASPLYSLKATLKVLGILIVVPFVVYGGVRLVFSPALAASVPLQVALGIIAFLLVTTGLCVAIIRITDRHVAQLPPSVRVTTLHRHRILRWIGRLAAFLFIAAIAAVIVPKTWQWLPLFVALFPLIIGGPLLAILYMMARRNDLGLTEIRTTPWVRWDYSPETWQAWAVNQRAWQQAQIAPTKWAWLVLFPLVCTALFAIGPWLNGDFKRGDTETFIIVGGLSSMAVVMALAIYITNRTSPGRAYRRQLAAPPEAFFGDEGVFANGQYLPWTMSGQFLISARCEAGTPTPPASLAGVAVLTFESFKGNTTIKLPRRVPIPLGHEADLAILQKKIAAACLTATVALTSP